MTRQINNIVYTMQMVTYAELEYADLFADSSGRFMDGGPLSEGAIPPAAFSAGASDAVAALFPP